MNKLAIYTCITGGYDILYSHTIRCRDVDYFCFTDTAVSNNDWKIIDINQFCTGSDKQLISRYIKWNPHIFFSNYQYSIYIDPIVDIKSTIFFQRISDLINQDIKISLALHPNRKNIYEEAKACMKFKKDKDENINKYLSIIKDSYIDDGKLYFGAMIFRQHNDQTVKIFDTEMWKSVNTYTKRDQLLMPWVRQKTSINIVDFNNGWKAPIAILGIRGAFWYIHHGEYNRSEIEYNLLTSCYEENKRIKDNKDKIDLNIKLQNISNLLINWTFIPITKLISGCEFYTKIFDMIFTTSYGFIIELGANLYTIILSRLFFKNRIEYRFVSVCDDKNTKEKILSYLNCDKVANNCKLIDNDRYKTIELITSLFNANINKKNNHKHTDILIIVSKNFEHLDYTCQELYKKLIGDKQISSIDIAVNNTHENISQLITPSLLNHSVENNGDMAIIKIKK